MDHNEHNSHINVSYSRCQQCNARRERSLAQYSPWIGYQYVHEYLAYCKPRLEAIRTGANGGSTIDARRWYREFQEALDRRIYIKGNPPVTRKRNNGYTERLLGTRHLDPVKGKRIDVSPASYLREFSASCL